MKIFYFYILRCSDNSLYCGQTNNLTKRIKEHNVGKSRSAKYVRSRKPARLVYFEKYPDLSSAMKREIEVKKWSKRQKEMLINKCI